VTFYQIHHAHYLVMFYQIRQGSRTLSEVLWNSSLIKNPRPVNIEPCVMFVARVAWTMSSWVSTTSFVSLGPFYKIHHWPRTHSYSSQHVWHPRCHCRATVQIQIWVQVIHIPQMYSKFYQIPPVKKLQFFLCKWYHLNLSSRKS
jgi:hypothetical protein